MPSPVVLPESLQRYLASRPGAKLEKIHAEASRRSFYRIRRDSRTLVAMTYPEPAPAEVEKFCTLQGIFRAHGLRVPRIDRVLDDRAVILEDAGDLLLQRAWPAAGGSRRRRLLGQCRDILGRLAAVPVALAPGRLDAARQEWEMDFFLCHFYPRFRVRGVAREGLRAALRRLVGAIDPESAFAHRDFHSRNLLVLGDEIVMVDFQDSLLAPMFYDLASLAFDSYLDLGAARGGLFPSLAASGDDRALRQLRLTALQRNIKALGTFGFQAFERRHRVYARYIPRTVRHIHSHLAVLAEPELDILSHYFALI